MPCLCLVPGKHSTTSDNKICALDAAWDCIASKPAYSGSKWYRRQSSSEMSAGRPSRPMNSLKHVKSGAGSESIKCRRHPILPRCCQQKLGSPHHQTWHGLTSTQQKLRTKPTASSQRAILPAVPRSPGGLCTGAKHLRRENTRTRTHTVSCARRKAKGPDSLIQPRTATSPFGGTARAASEDILFSATNRRRSKRSVTNRHDVHQT